MILSEYTRRWVEIRLYQFCIDLYSLRNKSIDIIEAAETVCDFGGLDTSPIKNIISRMLNDTYYQPKKREIILLAHIHKFSSAKIAEYLKMTRQGVHKYIKENISTYTPLPRYGIDEDQEIIKFLNTLDKLKNLGI